MEFKDWNSWITLWRKFVLKLFENFLKFDFFENPAEDEFHAVGFSQICLMVVWSFSLDHQSLYHQKALGHCYSSVPHS